MTDQECHLARPFRLALRWVAGRDISRAEVDDRALDYLVRVGLVRGENKRVENVAHYQELALTEEGQRALQSIEGGS